MIELPRKAQHTLAPEIINTASILPMFSAPTFFVIELTFLYTQMKQHGIFFVIKVTLFYTQIK